jgi:hypothetical protein
MFINLQSGFLIQIAILNVNIYAENVRKALNFCERGLGRAVCTSK